MVNSEDEEEVVETPANVTVVAEGESTEALISKARKAGNMQSKSKESNQEKTTADKNKENSRKKSKSTKRSSDEIEEITEVQPFKIPKKPNSLIFPKDVRPDWLQEDEAIDELSRGEATNAISQWSMTKALMKQNELRQEKVNKSKGSLKKDQEVKVVKVEAGEDNATTILHPKRFSLRTPLLQPESYWSMMPVKWPETNKKVHLRHLGLDHVISAKTLEMIHDRSDTNIEIKKFSNVNVMIGREGSQKTQKVQQVGNSIELETKDTWLDMANMHQIEEALDNLVRIWMVMWSFDYGPANIRGVITKHSSFSKTFEHLDTRKKVLEDFVNKALQDNAIKAGQEIPPLSFKELDERAKDIMDRKNEFKPKMNNQNLNHNHNRSKNKNSRNQNDSSETDFQKMRSLLRNHKVRGKELCAWFNVKDGCQMARCDREHACGKFQSGKKEPCGEKHSAIFCKKT